MSGGAFPQFFWMVPVAIIFGFFMAFGIGANDVANSFGTSVASKALSLGQAIIVSSVFEFAGAILLGQSVTSTIRGGILNDEYYDDEPALLMFGNLSALVVASIMLFTFTAMELPVSTTHTIIASLIGFSIVTMGFESVSWKDTSLIFVSWVASPTFAGLIAFLFFTLVKKLIFREESSDDETFERAMHAYPAVVFAGLSVSLAFILLKAKKFAEVIDVEDFGTMVVLPISVGGAGLVALLTHFVIGPWLKVKVLREQAEHDEMLRLANGGAAAAPGTVKKEAAGGAGGKGTSKAKVMEYGDDDDSVVPMDDGMEEENTQVKGDSEEDGTDEDIPKPDALLNDPLSAVRPKPTSSLHAALDWFAERTYKQDLEAQSFAASKRAKEIWDNSHVHDPKTERLFSYLQVFTACLASFAHGANDVANAIAPLAAVLEIQETGMVESKAPVPKWILALGGAGICVGFTLFGYRTLRALGFKLTCITPSRGFCIELAAALSVVTASYLGIPVSSTQCLVGATVGAGVASGGLQQVQWLFLLKVSAGWVGIFFSAAIFTAGFFAYCIYSPSVAVY